MLIRLQSALIVCAQIELHRDWAASMEPLLIKSQHRRFSYNTYMCKINLEFATYLQLFIASERVGLGMGEACQYEWKLMSRAGYRKNPALKIADPSGELNQTTYRGKFELFEILCTI